MSELAPHLEIAPHLSTRDNFFRIGQQVITTEQVEPVPHTARYDWHSDRRVPDAFVLGPLSLIGVAIMNSRGTAPRRRLEVVQVDVDASLVSGPGASVTVYRKNNRAAHEKAFDRYVLETFVNEFNAHDHQLCIDALEAHDRYVRDTLKRQLGPTEPFTVTDKRHSKAENS